MGYINLNGATRTFDIADSTTLGSGTAEVQIAWGIIGSGGLTKTGAGTLALSSGSSSFSGRYGAVDVG